MVRPLLMQYHSRPVVNVRYNKDGDLFLSCSNDGRVCLMDSTTGKRMGCYEGHGTAAVKCCDINLNSTLVVSGGADSHVVFYHAETGEVICKYNHGGILKSVEFNNDPQHNNRLLTANDKFTCPNRVSIFEFDFSDLECPQIECHMEISAALPIKATKAKWGPFDETVITIHEEGTFCVWDVVDYAGTLLKLVQAHQGGPCTGIQFNDRKTLMLTCSRDQTVKVWETFGFELVKELSSNRPFNDCAISPLYEDSANPKYHIIAGGGVEARDAAMVSEGGFESVLFNVVMEEEVGTMRGHFGPMNSIAINPDGKSYVTGGEEGLLRLMHFDSDYFTRKDI